MEYQVVVSMTCSRCDAIVADDCHKFVGGEKFGTECSNEKVHGHELVT